MSERECTSLKTAIQQQYDEKVNVDRTLQHTLDELREVNHEKMESMSIIAEVRKNKLSYSRFYKNPASEHFLTLSY